MVVTIDGPAGAGKSSVARRLAERLGFRFLDTGAMYRAVALAGLRRGVNWDQPEELAGVAAAIDVRLDGDRVWLDGTDVTDAIRTPEITAAVRHAADHPAVRQRLGELQRQAARGANLVTEGRDQGTVVFPDAACKIFLTATAEERARRRVADLRQRGLTADFDDILAQQTRRDREDENRALAPLRKAADAIELVTDGLSREEVVTRLEQLVRSRTAVKDDAACGVPTKTDGCNTV